MVFTSSANALQCRWQGNVGGAAQRLTVTRFPLARDPSYSAQATQTQVICLGHSTRARSLRDNFVNSRFCNQALDNFPPIDAVFPVLTNSNCAIECTTAFGRQLRLGTAWSRNYERTLKFLAQVREARLTT